MCRPLSKHFDVLVVLSFLSHPLLYALGPSTGFCYRGGYYPVDSLPNISDLILNYGVYLYQ